MSADSMAMSLPLPMAQPTVAAVRAGASLMPSPTIITLRPCRLQLLHVDRLFPPAAPPAITSSTPTRAPMCSAAARLSPVSSTTRMPCLRMSGDGGGAGLLHRIRHGDQPQQRPVSGEEHGRFPLSRQGVSLFGKGGDVHAAFLHQPAVARQHRPAGEDRPKAPSGEQFQNSPAACR